MHVFIVAPTQCLCVSSDSLPRGNIVTLIAFVWVFTTVVPQWYQDGLAVFILTEKYQKPGPNSTRKNQKKRMVGGVRVLASAAWWCPPAAFLAAPPAQPWLLSQPSVTPSPPTSPIPFPLPFSERCQDFLGSDCQIGAPNVTAATTTSHIQPREPNPELCYSIDMGRQVADKEYLRQVSVPHELL